MFRRLALVPFVLLVIACGKRGDPHPPVPVIPRPTSDLVVTQRAGQMILTWSYPSLTTAGRSLTGVQRISVFRYEEELPSSAFEQNAVAGEEKIADVPRPITLFSKLPTIPQSQFARLSTRIDSIEEANLASVTAGSGIVFTDTPPFVTSDGRPLRLTYAVVTEGLTAKSELSNLAVIVPLSVASAPAGLTAVAKPEGITLTWEEPKTSVRMGQTPVISGYHVFRSTPGAPLSQFATPINNAPVRSTTYTDVPAYGEHEYRVAAVASSGPPLIQSDLSAGVIVDFRDRVPPPAPATVTPLIETNAVRLIWDPVEAADLAGYRIYRTEGIGHTNIVESGTIPIVVQPMLETTYLHTPVSLGIAFRYAVTAVDKNGNESARTWTNWIVTPKTP